MSTSKIITLGETLLDIIFQGSQPVAAKPGGSSLNTSVSLGRLGLPVSFISEWGEDEVGSMIEHFLNENGIDCAFANRYKDCKTSLALAFLDENRNASYSFYKQYPKDRLMKSFPSLLAHDYLMFGSFFALARELRPRLKELLLQARSAGSLVMYDPNFRKAHLHELNELKPILEENFRFANLVKGSDEDFACIFGVQDAQAAYDAIRKEGLVFIYTSGAGLVQLITPALSLRYEVPPIIPVSTIGAGDTFSAGILYGLYREKVSGYQLSQAGKDCWDRIIPEAIRFAGEVCMSYENYLTSETAVRVRNTI